ncbi:DUF3313 domain-containing protein [Bradyrhizobium sp. SSUT18]|uniref:DUF3313 domain-containing protein n=1 Tax=unclassified Bradyrhizobium TaxID=2631580 RepID=UPI002446C6C8|nr:MULTISPECIES: DUF3313 domain-containing protein [unclassified Bradyrhizobium]MDH2350975.1 DUF3313 domain-containing protein [Bradyrhizobium sp. SSUT112]MDH2404531.1 DUF3313 domain-containing protein [Bradyrhizobium sp. SSUT18]
MCVTLAVGGCATAPLERAGSLRSYDRMSDANGLVTRSQIRVNKKDVLAAKTIRIASTVFPARAEIALNEKERRLVANAISRELCLRLSERFRIVSADDDADLTVQATVTHAAPTDPTASGASKALSIAKTVALPAVPVPVPRLPVGLGNLSVEAEARDFAGFQKAAMVWARGANSIANSPRVANEGDAYDLAADFGADFAKLVATGDSPFGGIPALPPIESIPVRLGGAPKYVACEAFGRFPGLTGMAGQSLGLPPAWTDSGAKDSPAPAPAPEANSGQTLTQ